MRKLGGTIPRGRNQAARSRSTSRCVDPISFSRWYDSIFASNLKFVSLLVTEPDADPNNYMSFYRRGTVFLATGKFKPALQDFGRVIELKPDFTSVQFRRLSSHQLRLDHDQITFVDRRDCSVPIYSSNRAASKKLPLTTSTL